MGQTIDFGIDLGTTNSLIAKCVGGNVEVFREPGQGRETLPSVVGFRKERILVGQSAKTYAEKDSKSVVSRFKRKMGTTESFRIKSLGKSQTPVDLSAFVLKELKTFVHTGETVDAAVITVPASFDTVQSNDTREAGVLAGFKQVVLLQEPIAASLAYANKHKGRDLRNSQWLVYDLGGGTFDVALVRIVEGELKVIDHEGDNFLGGMDFDALIVERLIVPALERHGTFNNMLADMKSDSGKYNTLWYSLNHRAEQAKIELSTKTSSVIELSGITDDADEDIDFELTVTRSEFDEIIKPHIDRTADMIKMILARNTLRPADVQFVLMVGGSTYVPYVRRRVEELLQVPVNCEINPVTAVVEGAAYFAATREKRLDQTSASSRTAGGIRVKAVYNRTTQDDEELFSAKIDGATSGLSYRITRGDGGYDSGHKALSARISEDLPLQPNEYNQFVLKIVDRQGNPVAHDLGAIQIAHGKYGVAGQSVPHDICLVVDDLTHERTVPVSIFPKNQILPARKTAAVSANKTVLKGSDDFVVVKVVEGDADSSPEANLEIGSIRITGKRLERDLVKGSEIELTIEMSESRTLSVSAYVTSTNQVFEQTFSPERRDVDVDGLAAEVALLQEKIGEEADEAKAAEKYEAASELTKLERAAQELRHEVTLLSIDDVTDDRHKIADRKRKLAHELDALTKDKKLDQLRAEYVQVRESCQGVVAEHGNDRERKAFEEIVQQERGFLTSNNPKKVQQQIGLLRSIEFAILRRTPAFLVEMYYSLVNQRERFNDQSQAKSLIEAGRLAIQSENYDRLDEVIFGLINLLPQEQKTRVERSFTGISVG